jgi:hypothetical protein
VETVTLHEDERGLVGKLLVLWLIVLALILLALWDAGSIAIAYLRTANLAQDAAGAGALRFEETGERRQARRAAISAVATADEGARLVRIEVSRRGDVMVVVRDRAATLVAGRIRLLEDLTTVTSTTTASAR